MKETARELFDRMSPDLKACAWAMDEPGIDLQTKYRDAIIEVGAASLLAELFLHLADSSLTRCLGSLDFAWKSLPFSAWKEVLHLVSWSAPAVYQLVWSASELLGVDMVRLIQDDPQVDEVARRCAVMRFPRGAPRSYSSTGAPITPFIEPMWRRLAAEGAPMLYDLGSS